MIIILEGPDGSGKSTLAAKLAKQSGYPLIHRVAEDDQKPTVFTDYLDILNRGRNLILDRAWYSEMVYGPVFRDKAAITFPQMYKFEERLARVGGLIIYCTGHPNTLWDRCQDRGVDNPGGDSFEHDRELFQRVCHGYDRVMEVPHHIPVVQHVFREI